MYFKIALNNVRKSLKDYSIYFLTLTFAVCIFYSFNSISSQTLMNNINSIQESYIGLMNNMIGILSIGVSVILGCLIIYATNFLIKRRKKEFGIYMALGMSKISMSLILFFETLFIGIISLGAGLMLGFTLAQILSVFTAKLFAIEMTKYSFTISVQAIVKTIVYFGLMYFIVMFFNTIVVTRYKLIDLIYGQNKNEKVKIKNSYISSFILLISVIILGIAYRDIFISDLDFYTKEFKISIICGIIGTILFFYSISSLMMIIIKKNSKIYLNKLNLFTIKQLSNRFNTNFLSMSVICLMILVTIGSLSCGLTVKNSMESGIKKCTPVDATIFTINNENSEGGMDIISEGIKTFNIDMNDFNYSTLKVYSRSYEIKKILYKYAEREEVKKSLDYPMMKEIDIVTISDYNNFRKLKGDNIENLKNDELLICSNYPVLKDTLKSYLKNESNININGNDYKIKNKKIIDVSFYDCPIASNVFVLIVPDNFVGKNDKYAEVLNLEIKNNAEVKEKNINEKFMSVQKDMFGGNNKESKVYGFTRKMCYDSNRGVSAMALFIAVYIGIVFLLSSAAVLALQQLCECNDSIERYRILNKIGASKKSINKSILQQVVAFFMFPLMLALVHSYVGIKVVNSYVMALGESNNILPMLVTALIIIIVYGGYLYSTYVSYKNVVNNELY